MSKVRQPTRFCARRRVVGKKAYISSHWKAGVQVCPRDLQKNWLGLIPPLSQPQCGIELTVKKKRC
ncbi:hypothetical protein ACNKHL_23175 [Shigella flexneri]